MNFSILNFNLKFCLSDSDSSCTTIRTLFVKMASFSPGQFNVVHSDQVDNSEAVNSVRTFFRQSDAVAFAASETSEKFVFSFEVNLGGSRKYLVTNLDHFWSFYKNLPRSKRHYYEVIQSDKESKLYFDCEFDIRSNQQKDGHIMTRRLISVVNQRLLQDHGIRNSFQDVLVLESTSEIKFSVHLIFTQVYFQNNQVCGQFVKNLLRTLTEEEKKLLEISHHEQNSFFVDTTVYTRFRNLRLILSKKLGKQIHFDISRIDTFSKKLSYQVRSDDVDYLIFKSSLVTYTSESSTFLTLHGEAGAEEKFIAPTIPSSNLPTPFPELDNFIMEYIYPSSIRSWKYFKDSDLYCYYTSNYRFCHNIQKQHKRNCTYFLFYLKEVKLKQGCHKCRGYYSNPIELPQDLFKWVKDFVE